MEGKIVKPEQGMQGGKMPLQQWPEFLESFRARSQLRAERLHARGGMWVCLRGKVR
jgi:hypothetical protein